MIGLTLAAFPGACFSSFIAANSFKTVMPKVNPFISVGIGTIVSIILAITKVAGNLPQRLRDHRRLVRADLRRDGGRLPAGGQPLVRARGGFNPAGWIAWALGFLVGILPNLHGWNAAIPAIPAAPVAAFIVGAVVYFACAKAGLLSPVIAPAHDTWKRDRVEAEGGGATVPPLLAHRPVRVAIRPGGLVPGTTIRSPGKSW